MESKQRGPDSAVRSPQFENFDDSVAIAGEVARVFARIEAALVPVLGQRGVAALYQRCLHLTCVAHPWLCVPPEAEPARVELDALRQALVAHDQPRAAAAARLLLQSFQDLLATLVGTPLTERLLRDAWAPPTATHAQDAPS